MKLSKVFFSILGLWSLLRLALIFNLALMQNDGSQSLNYFFSLVWMATPGISPALLCILIIIETKPASSFILPLKLILLLDILMGIITTVFWIANAGSSGLMNFSRNPEASVWHVLVPMLLCLINAFFLWILYYHTSQKTLEA